MLLGKIEVEVLEGWRLREKESGLIMPWYTWPCLEWLSGLELKGKLIWEYGVGDSTLWYRHNGGICYGVESDKKWADYVGHTIMPLDKEEYINSITYSRFKFDLVIIDGIHRDECTKQALKCIVPGGHLIIDNFKQPSVEEHWPLTEKLIEGMPITIYKQPDHYDWQTAVITKP